MTMTSGRTVVGINIVTAFAAPTPFNLGQVFIGSLWILPLAYFIRFVPLVFRNAAASLAQIDPSVEEAAQNLGAGPWRTLRTVTLPLMTRGVLAGALMAFVQGFGEYVASVVVYPARFAPLSVEIYNRQYANELGSAFAYGSLQMLAILVVLIISELLENPRWRRRRSSACAVPASTTPHASPSGWRPRWWRPSPRGARRCCPRCAERRARARRAASAGEQDRSGAAGTLRSILEA